LEDVDWIYLAEDRDEWLALGEAVNKFGFHKMIGN
jgi:hypothetical protein